MEVTQQQVALFLSCLMTAGPAEDLLLLLQEEFKIILSAELHATCKDGFNTELFSARSLK